MENCEAVFTNEDHSKLKNIIFEQYLSQEKLIIQNYSHIFYMYITNKLMNF